jgi:hypothetical protein
MEIVLSRRTASEYLSLDPDVDGMIRLNLIFKMWDGKAWPGLIWLRIGTVVFAVMNSRVQ